VKSFVVGTAHWILFGCSNGAEYLAGLVVRMGENIDVYMVLVRKPVDFVDLGVGGSIILKWISKKEDERMLTGSKSG
jgi:hypothetical protein